MSLRQDTEQTICDGRPLQPDTDKLMGFAGLIAGMMMDDEIIPGEFDDDGEPRRFIMANDDAVSTLGNLISTARILLCGTAGDETR